MIRTADLTRAVLTDRVVILSVGISHHGDIKGTSGERDRLSVRKIGLCLLKQPRQSVFISQAVQSACARELVEYLLVLRNIRQIDRKPYGDRLQDRQRQS